MGIFSKCRNGGLKLLCPVARRTTPFAPDVDGLQEISALSTETALRKAVPFLEDLAEDPSFLEVEVPSILNEAEGAENWYVARRHEGDAYSLQVFVWPSGTGTRVHDHSSWGVYRCVAGSLLEKRYTRLDDGSRPDHARLEKAWQIRWSPDDGASTVLPGDGGIHSMTNLGDETAVSVHLYGPRTAGIDGRDYDPSRDHVCDRAEDPGEAGGQSRAA
ncbi:hypothetical protein GBA63_06440 [Rubrobacter tropicus]|uniref:Cysteine dioxygenase n=1 Tax=Rubrobacter tropicus TaxID=2653851 RepID=A0A6G8Q7M9_9ACTN|nr:cysteine dioxygenase family protein [Rubrobacter tropicus]QIN82327.1 hypothetical protein GBA63_06440 [Rubrobacter tropicus]